MVCVCVRIIMKGANNRSKQEVSESTAADVNMNMCLFCTGCVFRTRPRLSFISREKTNNELLFCPTRCKPSSTALT